MRAYNKFIKKVKRINIEVSEYRFLEGAGWVKAKDFDNLPNNLKKAYYWELESLNENKLKQLQSDAVNELSLLSDDQLKKTLKRLDFLNEFERFNEFIKSFYVKVDNNTYNGLDVSDFKILLDQCFYVDVPNKGNISIEFLTELTDQIFFKSALLDGLKWQIENLLPKQEQTKETDYWQDDADEITLISEYEKAVNKLIKGNDAGCFPMRFRMLPRVVLNENKYSTERKKYILKQMRLVLDGVKNTEIGSELFADLHQRIEPYEGIFSFVFSDTALPPQQNKKGLTQFVKNLYYENSLNDSIEKILNRFNTPKLYKLFEAALLDEYKNLLSNTCISFTDKDITNIFTYLKANEYEIPIIIINEHDYTKVKHFVRKIENYEFAFNVFGLSNSKNDKIAVKCYNLTEIIDKYSTVIEWMNLTSINNELDKIGYYKNLIDKLSIFKIKESELEVTPPQQDAKQETELNKIESSENVKKLKSIWLAEPKITVDDFLQKGNDKGFWNDNLNLTIQKSNSTYGTGKTFLGNVFIAFKGWAIPEHFDYKEAGKVFCEVFNIKIKESIKEPYKAFSSGNRKQIAELKRTFGVK